MRWPKGKEERSRQALRAGIDYSHTPCMTRPPQIQGPWGLDSIFIQLWPWHWDMFRGALVRVLLLPTQRMGLRDSIRVRLGLNHSPNRSPNHRPIPPRIASTIAPIKAPIIGDWSILEKVPEWGIQRATKPRPILIQETHIFSALSVTFRQIFLNFSIIIVVSNMTLVITVSKRIATNIAIINPKRNTISTIFLIVIDRFFLLKLKY